MMIKTSRQLKNKIRNLAKEKSADAQILMRSYMMERFLERISLSEYKKHFVLKGGVLISSQVGFDLRSTMDIDATIQGLNVNLTDVEKMVEKVIAVPLDDNVIFEIKKLQIITEEAEYPGIRASLQALFDGTVTPLKLDVSAGDIITPSAVMYSYELMFGDRSIKILSYNLETVLAEKLETIIHRHVTNTRMRDFYDIFILNKLFGAEISEKMLERALEATARQRGSTELLKNAGISFDEIEASEIMEKHWQSYQDHFEYARIISWHEVMAAVRSIFPIKITKNHKKSLSSRVLHPE